MKQRGDGYFFPMVRFSKIFPPPLHHRRELPVTFYPSGKFRHVFRRQGTQHVFTGKDFVL